MRYLHRQAKKRKEPGRIMPGAESVVVVTRSYDNPDTAPPSVPSGKVAKYARGPDYHDALAQPLEELASVVRSTASDDEDPQTRCYVDAGPVPERELAQRAGLGWIGKNTCLIDPKRGSLFFIASVFTNLKLTPDAPFVTDHCGTCTRCLDACPTDAFVEPRVLDSRKCISYLTIEYRGEFDRDTDLHGWLFGCDVCQTVCPWNEKFSRAVPDSALPWDQTLEWLPLDEVAELTESTFAERFGHTPFTRPGVANFIRNGAIIS